MSRAVAVVALVGLISGYAWDGCLGWQPTAAMRAACCKAADHPCAGHDPDDCCAQGESNHQDFSWSSAPAAIVAPAASILTVLHPPLPRSIRLDVDPPRLNQRVARYVLLSVFLV